MAAKRDTSNSGLFDRLDALRVEVKGDISSAVTTVTTNTMSSINALAVSQGRLEKKFDDLEAGRLTRAEGHINDLRLSLQKVNDSSNNAEKTLSGKFLALGAIGMVVLSALMSLVVAILSKKVGM